MLQPKPGNFSANDPFDNSVFNKLFRELYIPLCQYCQKFVFDADEAEDIVQEAFIYLWEHRKRMERIASLKAYLYTTVKHKSLNFLQKQFRRRGDMTLENITSDVEDTKIPPPDELLGNKELVTILQDALKSLPPGCRQIFSMKRFGGLSNKEIADMLQISVKTVEAQMTIALKKLSVFISANWETLVFFFTVSFLEFL